MNGLVRNGDLCQFRGWRQSSLGVFNPAQPALAKALSEEEVSSRGCSDSSVLHAVVVIVPVVDLRAV